MSRNSSACSRGPGSVARIRGFLNQRGRETPIPSFITTFSQISIISSNARCLTDTQSVLITIFTRKQTNIPKTSVLLKLRFLLVFACLILTMFISGESYEDDDFLSPSEKVLNILEKIIMVQFTFEYILRLWSAGCRSRFVILNPRKYQNWNIRSQCFQAPARKPLLRAGLIHATSTSASQIAKNC